MNCSSTFTYLLRQYPWTLHHCVDFRTEFCRGILATLPFLDGSTYLIFFQRLSGRFERITTRFGVRYYKPIVFSQNWYPVRRSAALTTLCLSSWNVDLRKEVDSSGPAMSQPMPRTWSSETYVMRTCSEVLSKSLTHCKLRCLLPMGGEERPSF